MRKKKPPIPLSRSSREYFRIFYEHYKLFLFYIAGQYTEKRVEQEDLVQEALLRLMKHTDILQALSQAQTAKYIALTVKAVYLDQQQHRCREKLLFLDQAALQEELLLRHPESAVDTVAQLRADLSQREWLALEGKYILGYSHEELSRLLGVSKENMRSIVSRARQRAKQILEDLEEGE